MFNQRSYSVTYGVKISNDGKKWVDLVPRKTVVKEKIEKKFICKETFRKVAAKYVRVTVYKIVDHNRKASWTGIYELNIH